MTAIPEGYQLLKFPNGEEYHCNKMARLNFQNKCGFSLIELIATMMIISVLAAVLIPRYIDAETSAKVRGLDLGVSEMNGRETLTWAMVKLSDSGYIDDVQVWNHLLVNAGTNLGPDYDWTAGPRRDGGTLRFKKDVWSVLNRAFSSSNTPGNWHR